MSSCTFFGHRDCPYSIFDKLCSEIEFLIVNNNVTIFYVGTQGNFDILVYKSLIILKKRYPHIQIYRVLAYMPKLNEELSDSIIPDGIELINPRYAISKRNKWLIENSEYVIYYLTRNFGGASKFVEMARRKNKIMISIL